MEAERLIAIVATFAVGAIVALQPPVNSELGKQTTVLVAAFVGTAIAAGALGLLVVAAGQAGDIGKAFGVNPLYLTGGLMGALLISVSLVAVRTLGAGGSSPRRSSASSWSQRSWTGSACSGSSPPR